MDINCPECGACFTTKNKGSNTCPACMFSFSTDKENSLPRLMEIEVQGENGESLGVMDIYMLKELIYSGGLKGREIIRPINGDWMPIGELSTLREIFMMMGIDLVAVKVQSQKIKGWQTQDKPKPKKQVLAKTLDHIMGSREFTKVDKSKIKLRSLIVVLLAIGAAIWLF
jgi:hypothetical protein